jgi:hypothetical protein
MDRLYGAKYGIASAEIHAEGGDTGVKFISFFALVGVSYRRLCSCPSLAKA